MAPQISPRKYSTATFPENKSKQEATPIHKKSGLFSDARTSVTTTDVPVHADDADDLEAFRKTWYGLNRAICFTSPGLSSDALLKKTVQQSHPITECQQPVRLGDDPDSANRILHSRTYILRWR